MALLGLLLLPSDYRAGAEVPHGHAFVQLWVDASDGTVHHGHHHQNPFAAGNALATSWFDPAIGDAENSQVTGVASERPDVAEQQESAPAASGIHLLLAVVIPTLAVGVRLAPETGCDRLVAGLAPRIPLPPPRQMPAAA